VKYALVKISERAELFCIQKFFFQLFKLTPIVEEINNKNMKNNILKYLTYFEYHIVYILKSK